MNKLYSSYIYIYKGIKIQNIMTQLLWGLEKMSFKVCPLSALGAPPHGLRGSAATGSIYDLFWIPTPNGWPLPSFFEICSLVLEIMKMKMCFFPPLGPLPKNFILSNCLRGHPSICHEQTILFIHKGIYNSAYKILWLYYFWVWRRRFLKYAPLLH